MKKRELMKKNYRKLRDAGFTAKEANRLRLRRAEVIEELIQMSNAYIKQRDEFLDSVRYQR